jgi:uncharacterized protein
MTIYFLDSSAIAKRYISEIGSPWIHEITDPTRQNDLFLARITWVVTQYPLRAYDAIQLAAALSLKTTLNQSQLPAPIFLTADKKLLTIAQQAGLPCDNPNNHP